MNKLLKFILYIICLYAVETFLCFLLFVIQHKYKGYDGWGTAGALRHTLDINGVRIIFYGFFQCMLFALLLTYNSGKAWRMALINTLVYVGLSLAASIIFPFAFTFFAEDFFFFLVVSTFLSPFILSFFKFRIEGFMILKTPESQPGV